LKYEWGNAYSYKVAKGAQCRLAVVAAAAEVAVVALPNSEYGNFVAWFS
jgi:hypothetical protein